MFWQLISSRTQASGLIIVSLSFASLKDVAQEISLRFCNPMATLGSVWERGSTRVPKKFEFFVLLKFNMVCTFWIVLMC